MNIFDPTKVTCNGIKCHLILWTGPWQWVYCKTLLTIDALFSGYKTNLSCSEYTRHRLVTIIPYINLLINLTYYRFLWFIKTTTERFYVLSSEKKLFRPGNTVWTVFLSLVNQHEPNGTYNRLCKIPFI